MTVPRFRWTAAGLTPSSKRDSNDEHFVRASDYDDAVAQGRHDTARLDWLARHPRMTEMHTSAGVEHGHAYAVVGHASLSLREVIDAIMTADAGGLKI